MLNDGSSILDKQYSEMFEDMCHNMNGVPVNQSILGFTLPQLDDH